MGLAQSPRFGKRSFCFCSSVMPLSKAISPIWAVAPLPAHGWPLPKQKVLSPFGTPLVPLHTFCKRIRCTLFNKIIRRRLRLCGFSSIFCWQGMKRIFHWRRFFLWLNCLLFLAASFFFFLYTIDKQWRFPVVRFRGRHSYFEYKLNDNRGKEITIFELLLPDDSAQIQERSTLMMRPEGESLLLMWDLDFSDKNLRGCPDWRCKVVHNRTMLPLARAVFFASAPDANIERRPNQYFVHYSQESPANMPGNFAANFFNMSFGFRMDTPAASPYGFAARLAAESRPGPELSVKLEKLIKGKTKPVAWFVSHCLTQSGREWIAKELEKRIKVDVYGGCGPLKCARGDNCKEMLDNDYFFYFAAENSICRDYLTEKIWDQGLDSFSVPIVLRRSLVEQLLPPNSFIAVDDFPSVEQLAAHLDRLMANPHEYLRYFEWRSNFVAIKLNGDTDPRGERLFGVCQVCRLTQMEPRPEVRLPSPMNEWWDKSCERQGKLVEQLKANARK